MAVVRGVRIQIRSCTRRCARSICRRERFLVNTRRPDDDAEQLMEFLYAHRAPALPADALADRTRDGSDYLKMRWERRFRRSWTTRPGLSELRSGNRSR